MNIKEIEARAKRLVLRSEEHLLDSVDASGLLLDSLALLAEVRRLEELAMSFDDDNTERCDGCKRVFRLTGMDENGNCFCQDCIKASQAKPEPAGEAPEPQSEEPPVETNGSEPEQALLDSTTTSPVTEPTEAEIASMRGRGKEAVAQYVLATFGPHATIYDVIAKRNVSVGKIIEVALRAALSVGKEPGSVSAEER